MSDEQQQDTTPAGPATEAPERLDQGELRGPPEQARDPLAEAMERGEIDLAGNVITPEYAAQLGELDKIMTPEKLSEEEQEKNFALAARAQNIPDDVIPQMLIARRARLANPDSQIGEAFDKLKAEEFLAEQQDWFRKQGLLPAEEPAETPAEETPAEVPEAWSPEQQAQLVLPTADIEAFAAEIGVPAEPLARMRDVFTAPFVQRIEKAEAQTAAAVAGALKMRVAEAQRNDPDGWKIYGGTLVDLLRGVDPQYQPVLVWDDNLWAQYVGAAKGQHLDKLQKPAPEGKVVGRFTGEEARPSTSEPGVSVHPDVVRRFGLTAADLATLQRTRGSTR